jgi:hypothetical protein
MASSKATHFYNAEILLEENSRVVDPDWIKIQRLCERKLRNFSGKNAHFCY